MALSKIEVEEGLEFLRKKDAQFRFPGASSHKYQLNPPLRLDEVEAFEREHAVSLPSDYRDFITSIGNGGAGPNWGLFPLCEYDGGDDERIPLREGEGIGILAEPFRFRDAWNLPDEFFDQEPDLSNDIPMNDQQLRDQWRQIEEWHAIRDAQYANPSIMNGAIPLSDIPSDFSQWLVINGDQRGYMWNDERPVNAGLSPVRNANGEQMTFTDWYEEWLENLKQLPVPPDSTQANWNANHALPEWLFVPTLAIVLAAGISTARLLGVRNKLAFLAIALVCCFASVAVLSGFDKWLVERRKLQRATKNDEVA